LFQLRRSLPNFRPARGRNRAGSQTTRERGRDFFAAERTIEGPPIVDVLDNLLVRRLRVRDRLPRTDRGFTTTRIDRPGADALEITFCLCRRATGDAAVNGAGAASSRAPSITSGRAPCSSRPFRRGFFSAASALRGAAAREDRDAARSTRARRERDQVRFCRRPRRAQCERAWAVL